MYRIAEARRGFESDMAYPQFKNRYSQQDVISVDTWVRLQRFVLERLNNKMFGGCAQVREHMLKILDGNVPFGMRIVGGE